MTPGIVSGSVTWTKAQRPLAYRSRAAATRSTSSRSMDTYSGRIANGRNPYVMPRITDEVGVEQDDRLGGQPERRQDRVDDPVVAEDDHPGVGADEVAGPERQHHQDEQQDLAPAAVARDPVGQGIADGQAQDRRDRRVSQRVQGRGQEAGFERPRVVVEGDPVVDDPVERVPLPEADEEDDRQRDDVEQDQPGDARAEQGERLRADAPSPCGCLRGRGSRDLRRAGGHRPRITRRAAAASASGTRRGPPGRGRAAPRASRRAPGRGSPPGRRGYVGSMNSLAAAFGPM